MNWKIIVVIVLTFLLCGIASFYVMNEGFYSISADESSRTLIAYYWYTHGIIESTSWLPLHFLLMGSGFYILPDLVLLPRLISLLFGILTIISAGFLANIFFRNILCTVIAMVLTAFLPERFLLSILPLPEIIYIFFIVSGSYFLYQWLSENKIYSLFVTALLWSFAALLRYESWIFLVSLSGLGVYELIHKNIRVRQFLFLLTVNSIIPAAWLLYNYLNAGSWFYFLDTPVKIFSSTYSGEESGILNFTPIYQFIKQNIASLNMLGITALFFLRKNKVVFTWSIVLFLPLFILSVTAFTGKTLPAHNFWRISAVWSVLLVPFTAYLIIRVQSFFGNAVPIVLMLLLIFEFSQNTYTLIEESSGRYTLNKSDIFLGEMLINYVNNTNNDHSRILIESVPTYEHFNVVLASQDPFRFIYSEGKKLEPIRKEKYANIIIDFYLVNSFSVKRKLLRDQRNQKLMEFNDWMLFRREPDQSTRL